MKICFAGTPDFALPILEAVINSAHSVQLAVTQPDRPRGRGQRPWAPPVKNLALSCGVPVVQPEDINGLESLSCIKAAGVDAIVVAAYGRRLRRRILSLPRFGCFNLHASLLPKYRGAAPIEHAVLNGERETGVTIQRMALRIDTGAILVQRSVRIEPEENSGGLSARLSKLGSEMIVPFLDDVEAGRICEIPQDETQASFAPPLEKKDGLIRWGESAQEVHNRIRAMTPWPGAFTFYRTASGQERGRVIVLSASLSSENSRGKEGEVSGAGKSIVVVCGQGSVEITRVKPEGGKEMDAAAFCRGRGVKPGDFFHG